MPEQKDAITAIMGASATLAGFLLVFFGLLLPAIQATESWSVPAGDHLRGEQGPLILALLHGKSSVLVRLQGLLLWVTFAFVWSLCVVLLSLFWFLFPGAVLFWCTVVTFGVEVIGLIVLGIRIVPPLVQASVAHSEPADRVSPHADPGPPPS
jgi:hypothetical protein